MKYIPLHKCETCKQLSDKEHGSYAVMHGGPAYPLHKAANALEAIEELDTETKKNRHIKKCPICRLYYLYDVVYDYDVTGSTDDITLTRLTPTEVQHLISAKEYDLRIKHYSEELTSPHTNTKQYAAKSLTAHYLAAEEIVKIEGILALKDQEIEMGILRHLNWITESWWLLTNQATIIQIAEAASKNEFQDHQALIKNIIARCKHEKK